MTALTLTDLAIGYDAPLASGINLDLASGEIVAVTGPSGCGKSTLLQTLVGSLPALAGRISVEGVDVTDLPINQRRIGIVFQEPLLFPHLDVAGNIGYGPQRLGRSATEVAATVAQMLELVGLAGLGNRPVKQLSGGQAQRVALARALAGEPRVLLLDEPFSALDSELRHRLSDDVRMILKSAGVAALHVTHDLAEAERFADSVRPFERLAD